MTQAGCSLVSILPWTLDALLRRWPQLGLKIHHILAGIVMGALMYHLIDQGSFYRWVLLGGICAGLVWTIATCLHTMWHHRSWRILSQQALARSSNRLLWLDIAVPVEWAARPGQYVQLWAPHWGFRACLQLPAFYVASVDTVESTPETRTTGVIRIVTRPRLGMTKRIARAADRAHETIRFPIYVLGPYGHSPPLGQYGTVVFVLESVGLFRALPFIRHLVQESRSRRSTVRRLEVMWQVELKISVGPPCFPTLSMVVLTKKTIPTGSGMKSHRSWSLTGCLTETIVPSMGIGMTGGLM